VVGGGMQWSCCREHERQLFQFPRHGDFEAGRAEVRHAAIAVAPLKTRGRADVSPTTIVAANPHDERIPAVGGGDNRNDTH